MKTKLTIVYLQELIKKVYCDGVINNALVVFKDGKMSVDAIGIEDKKSGVVDGTVTMNVSYPVTEITEPGESAIGDLGDFLSNLGLFEKDDAVNVYTQDGKIFVERESPRQVLSYDLIDKKFVKSIPVGDVRISFESGRVMMSKGERKKEITFDAMAKIEGAKLKEYGATIAKLNPKFVPVKIFDGKLFTSMKGETKSLEREVGGILEISGSAESKYDDEFLKISKQAIGTATMRLSENSKLYINYEHEGMLANYLIQVSEEE